MKSSNQLTGGVSGVIEACLYLFGFIILFSVMQPVMEEAGSGLDRLEAMIGKKRIYQTWTLFIYVVFGIVLVPLTVAIQENFKDQTTVWAKSTPVLGFIWSGLVIASGMIGVIGIDSVSAMYSSDPDAALTSWNTIEAIQDGLGGGVEIIGGLWVFLISVISIRQSAFHAFLNYFGLMVGGAGILTMSPGLKGLGAVFGLTQIVWFLWIGIVMMKNGLRK